MAIVREPKEGRARVLSSMRGASECFFPLRQAARPVSVRDLFVPASPHGPPGRRSGAAVESSATPFGSFGVVGERREDRRRTFAIII